MIISTFGEFICLPVNMILFDIIGRRKTGAIDLAGCATFFILLQINMPQHFLTAVMLLVRGFSAANFNFVYIYTAEVYPTTIRTLGIGTASAWARVGAMLTPFVAQVLLDTSLSSAVWVYGSLGLLAAVCSWTLPIETKSRALPVSTIPGENIICECVTCIWGHDYREKILSYFTSTNTILHSRQNMCHL
ncbi:putative transporter SVOPL [Argopecten irradians]|uniref:putative transporter SVOPL n=1 Tax=Argopecten irradians TaxID=31199 RepID=UPI00371351C9